MQTTTYAHTDGIASLIDRRFAPTVVRHGEFGRPSVRYHLTDGSLADVEMPSAQAAYAKVQSETPRS